MAFVELSATTNFTFLTGASHPEEMIAAAGALGMPALAVADLNSVAGIVRAHTRARELARDGGPRIRLLPAARIVTREGLAATVLPRDRAAWGRLCRLLTLGRRRAPKGQCDLGVDDLAEWSPGMDVLLHPPETVPKAQRPPGGAGAWVTLASRLTRRLAGQAHLLVAPRYDGQDGPRIAQAHRLAARLGLAPVASALPMMHTARRRRLADVLAAIRLGCRVEDLGRRALANGEGRLRGEAEMLRLFRGHEATVHRSGEIAARLGFSLDELRYEYPSEVTGDETAAGRLARLARDGAALALPEGRARQGAGADGARAGADRQAQAYEPYFLTVNDIVTFARDRASSARAAAAPPIRWSAMRLASPRSARDRHHGVRAFRLRGPQRAARHRRRFRA
jgi:error-prone DNA polymerase